MSNINFPRRRLDPSERQYMEGRGSRHTLIIRRMEKEDFANYSCYASNTLGRDRAYITLRGKSSLRHHFPRSSLAWFSIDLVYLLCR